VSDSEINELTHHAMLVAWGEFAQSIGLIQEIERVSLHQKTVTHRLQTKTLEFFVAILAGLEHLKDLSRSAHPIDQDRAVAKAWLQPAWADYSGVSRTLTTLYQEEVEQVAGVLHKITFDKDGKVASNAVFAQAPGKLINCDGMHRDAALLVHARRTGLLPEAHRPRVFSDRNPFSVGACLVDGSVAGTWTVRDGRIALDLLEALGRRDRDAVEEERAALEAFHAWRPA